MQTKLVERDDSEGSEGSTEAREYSKENSHLIIVSNIQNNYKK
jgi:hypothetical protein